MGVERPLRRRYPRKAEVARAVDAVMATGIPVSTVALHPDGTISLSTAKTSIKPGNDDGSAFDAWERAGRL